MTSCYSDTCPSHPSLHISCHATCFCSPRLPKAAQRRGARARAADASAFGSVEEVKGDAEQRCPDGNERVYSWHRQVQACMPAELKGWRSTARATSRRRPLKNKKTTCTSRGAGKKLYKRLTLTAGPIVQAGAKRASLTIVPPRLCGRERQLALQQSSSTVICPILPRGKRPNHSHWTVRRAGRGVRLARHGRAHAPRGACYLLMPMISFSMLYASVITAAEEIRRMWCVRKETGRGVGVKKALRVTCAAYAAALRRTRRPPTPRSLAAPASSRSAPASTRSRSAQRSSSR